jgi:ATP-dependent protease Clp ATPase subunit
MLDYLEEKEDKDDAYTDIPVVTVEMDASPNKRRTVYKAVKGDQVDEALEKIINAHNVALPVIRIRTGKYLIGTDAKMAEIRGSTCMVRVGGGYQKLDEYIERVQEAEMDKIKRMMSEGKTYNEVIIDLLTKYGAENAVITQVQKSFRLQIANLAKK